MARKTTSKRLRLNPNFNKTIDTNLNVWSHDENSYEFRFEFYDDECDIPIDLTDAKGRILLLFKNECDKKHLLDLEIEDETLGFAKFTVPKRILGYEGTVNAHIYIDFEEKTHDFGNFLFKMKRSAIDEDFPELDTVYVSEFEKALEEIQEILRKFDGVEMDIDEKIKQIEQASLERFDKLENDVNEKLETTTTNIDETETNVLTKLDELDKKIDDKDVAKQNVVSDIVRENIIENSLNEFVLRPRNTGQSTDNNNYQRFRYEIDGSSDYTFSCNVEVTDGEFDIVSVILFDPPVTYNVPLIDGKITVTHKADGIKHNGFGVYAGKAGETRGNGMIIKKAKLEKNNQKQCINHITEIATKNDTKDLQKQIDELKMLSQH